jgi:hypothetical protein
MGLLAPLRSGLDGPLRKWMLTGHRTRVRGMAATPEEKAIYVTIWSKVVDTQMHFNEMSVKARQFGLAFVAAALGLAVVLSARGQEAVLDISLFGVDFKLHVSVVIAVVSGFSLYAVKLLDLGVYHRMLRGAVIFGEDFEQKYMKEIFDLEKGMTQAISHYSRYQDANVSVHNGQYKYSGDVRRTAEKKINKFYSFSISALFAMAVMLFVVTSNLPMFRSSEGNAVNPDGVANRGAAGILPGVPTNAK